MFKTQTSNDLWLVKFLLLTAIVAIGYAFQLSSYIPKFLSYGVPVAQAAEYPFYRVTNGTMESTMPKAQGFEGWSAHGFRFTCVPSHFSYDDPVVYPGKPGAAHLHMFFGNTDVTYKSTSNSIVNSGASTCAGGITNRSAYWVPTMFNDKGEPVLASFIINYYKSWDSDRDGLKPIPQGLQILANDKVKGSDGVIVARPDHPEDVWDGSIGVYKNDEGGVNISVSFPNCIAVDSNGDPVLTSPGGTSHMAYGDSNGCPASHPYHIPTLTQNIRWYTVPYESNWQLASDKSPATKGQTAHADYMAGWTKKSAQIMADCVRTGQRECGPPITGGQGDAFSYTPSGKQIYRWEYLMDSADDTPMGKWPKMLSGSMTMPDMTTTTPDPVVSTPITTPDPVVTTPTPTTNTETTSDTPTGTKVDQKFPKDTLVHNTANIKVRTQPAGDVIRVVKKGAHGKIISSKATKVGNRKWIRVRFYNGTTGWVAENYIAKDKAQNASTPATTDQEYQDMVEQIRQLRQLIAALKVRLAAMQNR